MSLLMWDKDISTTLKYSEVGNIRFISIEYLNGHFSVMMMHWLAIIDVQ